MCQAELDPELLTNGDAFAGHLTNTSRPASRALEPTARSGPLSVGMMGLSEVGEVRSQPGGSMPAPGTPVLRICHLAYTFLDTDNRVRRYAESLASYGHSVDVVSLRRDSQPASEERGGVREYRLQLRNKTEGAATTYLAKLLLFFARATAFISIQHARRPYDVLHVHNVPDFLVFAAWLPKLTGARIILDIHDILPELYCDKFHKSPKSWTFRGLKWLERQSSRF